MIDRDLVMDLRAEIRKIAREEVKKAIEEHDKTTDKRTETHACDLIDRQAAIDEWKNDFKGYINALNMPKDDYDGIMEYIDELPSAQQWIPCSERLPEDDVEVLVTDDAGGVQWLGVDKMLSYEDGSGRFWLISQHPSAWMPLPEPYRGEGGNA